MAEPKLTTMVIKVDLQCHKCYKKIKNVLCKFPQIRDQVYDEKKNKVTIKVVCCSPEKIKQKICCKGGESVKGIEIIVPKPSPPAIDKPTCTETPKPKDQTPKKTEPTPSQNLVPVEAPPIGDCCTECSEGRGDGPCKLTETVKPNESPKKIEPPPLTASTIGVCCTECSEGRGGGPCYRGCRFPRSPPSEKSKETGKKTEPPPCHPIGVCCTECSEGRGGGPCYRGCRFPPSLPSEKPTDKPKEKPKKPEPSPCYPPVLVPVVAFPIGVCCTECSEGRGGGPCYRRYGCPPPPAETAKPKETPKNTELAPSHLPLVPVAVSPVGVCCTECSEGRGGGPCYRGYGSPPPRFYEGYCGRPVYDNWGGGYRYRDGYYVCEENASACSIM